MAAGCFRVAALTAVGCLSVWSAVAAEITVDSVGSPGDETTMIAIDGEIVDGDDKSFANTAIATQSAVVLLNSPGGNLAAGIAIGQAIRLKGYATVVPEGFQCASACALAWLGGTIRFMAAGATVGFHAVYAADDPDRRADSVGNALVGAYLNQLGLPSRAVAYIAETQPDDIRWLTFDDAERIGIDVIRFPPEQGEQTATTGERTVPTPDRRDWSAYGDWIQLYSRSLLAEAIEIAVDLHKRLPNVFVFHYSNGWYVVAIGPYADGAEATRDRLVESGAIPDDSLVNSGRRFSQLVWGSPPDSARSASAAAPDSSDSTASEAAIAAAETFFRTSSEANDAALAYLRRVYAAEVDYFGKPTAKSDVLQEKVDFVARWPERSYVVQPGAEASCDIDGLCTVKGTVRWRAHSNARHQTSSGLARFTLTFATSGRITLVAESSEVVSRSVRAGR